MHRIQRSAFLFVIAVVLFSACNTVPDHARYIPKDAVVVAGINLKGLSKKIAWNVITGSKLFKEMQDRMPQKNAKDAVSGIEKAGLDFANTFYLYVKNDNRYKGGNLVAGLVPLSDAGQWEDYVKRTFDKVNITQHGDRKEASLGEHMYVGWDKKLLVIINVMHEHGMVDVDATAPASPETAMAMATAMDDAFKVTKENSIMTNKHFLALEKEGHDVTVLLNYEQLMNQVSGSLAEKMSMSLSSSLWKDAAMAAGFNFEKGKITGDMHYYLSPEMHEIGKAFGGTNADNEMISRLPLQNMDMVAAAHISPEGIRMVLEKMNLLGLVNLGLSTQGLTAESVLDAFTGDMAFVMSDFTLHTESVTDSFMGQTIQRKTQKASVSMCYVVKIRNKDNFSKLMKMVKDMGLQQIQGGYSVPITATDTAFILMNDQYLAVSNRYASATGFLNGTFKGQKLPDAVSAKVTGHPSSFYFDVQQFCRNLDADLTTSPQDSTMVSETKKLLNNVSLTGGEYKSNAFEYHLDINFMNADENSIIALMDYGMRMNDAGKQSQNPL